MYNYAADLGVARILEEGNDEDNTIVGTCKYMVSIDIETSVAVWYFMLVTSVL